MIETFAFDATTIVAGIELDCPGTADDGISP
ncbi:hypothetical protein BKA07_000805 [Brevibacterium marinum]|uniref:Uncharacterized protein n=1 Tax=Brevibacterium marinum TaxID=418643 RepID=A0A846RXD4_9MICO|nr:hypothetical protein [Brevibacterium marinum]